MRILKIIGGDDYGGQFVCECQFIEFWRKNGVTVDAIIVGKGRALDVYIDLVDTHFIIPKMEAEFGGSITNRIKGIINSFSYVKKNKNLLNKYEDYDAVIYRSQIYLALAAFVGNQCKSHIYWHLPNAINITVARIFFNVMLRLKRVIPVANSKYTLESVGELCKHVVYPGFNSDRVKKQDISIRNDLEIEREACVIGSAARIEPNKAQDLIINAFIDAGLPEKNWHLIIAGIVEDQDFYNECKRIAQPYTRSIHFVGMIEDMPKFYSGIDVYFNGRRDAEPFGISIAEALGAGKPVVAYFKGGPSEMIQHKYNGWLIPEPTKESYTETLRELFEADLNKMGKNSYAVSEKFKYEFNAQKFLSIIRSSI